MRSSFNDYELCRIGDELKKNKKKRLVMSEKYKSHDICDQIDSILGWKPRSNCSSDGNVGSDGVTKISYTTNSLGARGNQEIPFAKKNKMRILFIGDSFTWGEDVQDSETFPALLQNKLGNDFEVVNLGVHGYGLGQSLLRLETEGVKYNPDLVILGFFMPDITRDSSQVFGYFKPRFYIDENSGLLQIDTYIPTIEEAIVLSEEHNSSFRLMFFSKLYYEFSRLYDRLTSFKKDLRIASLILRRMKLFTDERNIKFSVLYIPTSYSIEERSNFQKKIGYDASFWGVVPEIKDLLKTLHIDFLNPVEKMKEFKEKSGSRLYYGHTTRLGNEVLSNVVFDYVTRKEFNAEH